MVSYKINTKIIGNILFQQVEFLLSAKALELIKEIEEEERFIETEKLDTFLKKRNNIVTASFLNINGLVEDYLIKITCLKSETRLFYGSVFLNSKNLKSQWLEVKNDARANMMYTESRKQTIKVFKELGLQGINELLWVRKLKKRSAF